MAKNELIKNHLTRKGWWIVVFAILALLLIVGELWNNVSDELGRPQSKTAVSLEPTPTPPTDALMDERQPYEWDDQ